VEKIAPGVRGLAHPGIEHRDQNCDHYAGKDNPS
jgi:hypothetical protein